MLDGGRRRLRLSPQAGDVATTRHCRDYRPRIVHLLSTIMSIFVGIFRHDARSEDNLLAAGQASQSINGRAGRRDERMFAVQNIS